MAGSALLLTLTTLLGLALGFAREMLVVSHWGAGAKSDAFLVAMFIPDMLRTMLAAGLLSSAALPLWNALGSDAERRDWSRTQTVHAALLSLALALALWLGAPAWVRLVGPGLDAAAHAEAEAALRVLAWTLPGIVLQAFLALYHMASQRYALAGLGSLLFNLPAVVYLIAAGERSDPRALGLAFVLGSVAMAAVLAPGARRLGWAAAGGRWRRGHVATLYAKLWPLLASTAGSHLLTLVERVVASHIGEGGITLVNLARKLVGLPLVALMSLSQVALAQMSRRQGERLPLLRLGLGWATLICLPAAIGLAFGAAALVELFLPAKVGAGPLAGLLAVFSVSLLFGSWNALLARYYYAGGDTRTPLAFELGGNACNVVCAFALAPLIGLYALPVAATLGVMTTAALLSARTRVLLRPLRAFLALAAVLAAAAGLWLWMSRAAPPLIAQLAIACALAAVSGAGAAWVLRPWKTAPVTTS